MLHRDGSVLMSVSLDKLKVLFKQNVLSFLRIIVSLQRVILIDITNYFLGSRASVPISCHKISCWHAFQGNLLSLRKLVSFRASSVCSTYFTENFYIIQDLATVDSILLKELPPVDDADAVIIIVFFFLLCVSFLSTLQKGFH